MKTEYYDSLSSAKRKAGNRRRFAIISILIIGIISLFIFKHSNSSSNVSYLSIKNIIDDEVKLLHPESKNLFFIETHLGGERKLRNARQACSIESAAHTNPDYDIYLIFATNEHHVVLESSPLVNVLLQYPNINIRYANLDEYSMGTPLEHFLIMNRLKESKYQLEHTSDALRALTLYKYGGVYLDMDVLSTFTLRAIGNSNFACLQSDNFFTGAIMGFDLNEERKYMTAYVNKIEENYNPDVWDCIGPSLVTRTLLSYCNGTKFIGTESGRCDEVTAIPNSQCFLTDYQNFFKFYEEDYTNEMIETFQKNRGFFIHIWNKMLEFDKKSYELTSNSKAAYMELAKIYCPRVVETGFPF